MIDRTSAVAILVMLAVVAPSRGTAADWNFELEPYAMATSISGDASVGRATGIDINLDMGAILEVLEIAGMLHFEAHADNGWGVALDYGFMDLGADFSGARGGVVDTDVRQGVLETLLVRRSELRQGRLDVIGGFRWWDNDLDVTIDAAMLPGATDIRVDEDWLDLVIGLRWTIGLNEQWQMQLRGDIGGLGLESDFTSTLAASFRYSLSQSVDLNLQYKATWVDYTQGSRGKPGYFQYDTATHGPAIGAIFYFR